MVGGFLDKARYYVGSHVADAASRVVQALQYLGPEPDVRDYSDGVQNVARSLMDGRWLDAAANAGYAGAGLMGVLVPGPSPRAMQRRVESALNMLTEARLVRAKGMGFRTNMPVYHGTASDITEFDLARGGRTSGSQAARTGAAVALDPEVANEFAGIAAKKGSGGQPNVLPLYHRAEKPAALTLSGDETDLEVAATLADAFGRGYDSVMLRNYTSPSGKTGNTIIFVKDAEQLRSAHAAFDLANIAFSREPGLK